MSSAAGTPSSRDSSSRSSPYSRRSTALRLRLADIRRFAPRGRPFSASVWSALRRAGPVRLAIRHRHLLALPKQAERGVSANRGPGDGDDVRRRVRNDAVKPKRGHNVVAQSPPAADGAPWAAVGRAGSQLKNERCLPARPRLVSFVANGCRATASVSACETLSGTAQAIRAHAEDAPVAQWIERLTTDQKVGGSSPPGRAINPLMINDFCVA